MKSRTKTYAPVLLLAALALMLTGPHARAQEAQAAPPPAVGMASGILVDATTGKILWANQDEAVRAPASLTKILTALVVLKHANLDDTAQITEEARNAPGSRTYAEAGWTFTIGDLLWGLMLQSGNDAAIALAQKVSPDGTIPGFMLLANQMAKDLGATNSTFMNPHGYDEAGHQTTARDLALITMAAMKDPRFAEMVATRTHDVPWGDGQPHTFINHNKLLSRYRGTVGVKTGFTTAAGHSLVSAVDRDGTRLIAVVMGSPDHYGESIALYDWGFGNLAALRANPVGIIRERRAPDRESSPDRVHGLEVIQLDPEDVAAERNSDPTSSPVTAPLVVPIAVGAASTWIGTRIIRARRRRHRQFSVMDQFQRELDLLSGAAQPEPAASSFD